MNIIGKERKIKLQKRKGNDIHNVICSEISSFTRNQFDKVESKYPNTEKLTEPSGIYNCFGMMFASRRCWVERIQDVITIIEDDNYREIELNTIRPGDLIVYYSDNGEPIHSGLIVEIINEHPLLLTPIVRSKWGCYGERKHNFNDCPYALSTKKYFRIFE